MATGLRCSFKSATALVCTLNIVAAVFLLQLLLGPHLYSSKRVPSGHWHRHRAHRFSAQEAKSIQESHEIRRREQPHQLIQRVKEIGLESTHESSSQTRDKLASEITERLRELQSSQNKSVNHKALSEWRKKKIEAAKHSNVTWDLSSTLAEEEATKLAELGWLDESAQQTESTENEDVSPIITIPEVEDGIIPGRLLPPECHGEAHTDYDGVAVRWGLTHHTESAADCCQACLDQAKSTKPGEQRCNIWVFCAAENGCYSPDIYEHKHQECWLKADPEPKLNFKGHYDEEYRRTHPNAPFVVPWVSGVISE